MTDLVAAIRAAIGETERIAQAASGDSVFDGTGIVVGPRGSAVMLSTAARHIARHDPAAVLRRCAADRKLLDWLVMCDDKASDNNWWSLDVNAAIELLAEAYGVEA